MDSDIDRDNNQSTGSPRLVPGLDKMDKSVPFDRYAEVMVAFPFIHVLCWIHSKLRKHLLAQVEWTTLFLMPKIVALRGVKFWDVYFQVASIAGEEDFYQVFIPIMMWNTDSHSVWPRSLVLLFTFGLFFGDFLKNLFALPRPPLRFLIDGHQYREVIDNRDFGWPSTHSLNAVVVPFFLIHHFWGGIWLWNSSHPFLTMFWHSMGLLWCASITVSRLYLGVHSPADVQGGMILGGVLLKLWIWSDHSVLLWMMENQSTPLYFSILCLILLLVCPRPAPPVANYTYQEVVTLLGFLHGFVIGAWLRWNFSPVFSVTPCWTSVIRTLVGFAFFLVSREVVKCVLNPVCKSIFGGWSSGSEEFYTHTNKLEHFEVVVKKDIYVDFHKFVARFFCYSYLGVMVTYLAPALFDALRLWA
eukprot:TRINITY_DN149_c0_g1_i2.p1 TRINITY_DN149_c0_g1~~TRINITY_DN149_c0_g1_i2.p1  ORF type:complete len:434 (+),score=88.92 TRINITY_DN149_c0_g1_i2:60-1304(+)